jgi:hypothetical protein
VTNEAAGDAPEASGPEVPRPRVLRFEVALDTFAKFRAAMRRLHQTAGVTWTTTGCFSRWPVASSGGAQEAGRRSYQIARLSRG